MAVSEAQKKASDKYNREHMTTLGCKIRKEQATDFKAYCKGQGKTSNTVLKDFVLECIGKPPTGAVSACEYVGYIPISPTQENAAQAISAQIRAHIEKTGEDETAFLERAAESTIKRDNVSLEMGINPATGEKRKEDASK